jgi:hypothetical protein
MSARNSWVLNLKTDITTFREFNTPGSESEKEDKDKQISG